MEKTLSWPKTFNLEEIAKATALIELAEENLCPYDKSWKANWLVNDIGSNIWVVKTHETKFENGEWTNTRNIDWELKLSNLSKLTDGENQLILNVAKKAAFLLRTLPQGANNFSSLSIFVNHIQILIRWLYLHEDLYQPQKYAFSLFTLESFKDFLYQYKKGGVLWLLGYPTQLLKYLYKEVINIELPMSVSDDIYSVPKKDKQLICNWLFENGFYKKRGGGSEVFLLNRKKLADILFWDISILGRSNKFSVFLSQFEPTNISKLYEHVYRFREYPSHRTLTIGEIQGRDDFNFEPYLTLIKRLSQLHKHLPNYLPSISNINDIRSNSLETKPISHTPWIPIDTALKYTTEAIRWVHLYGDDLIKHYLIITKILIDQKLLNTNSTSKDIVAKRERFVSDYQFPETLKNLNIKGWSSKLSNHPGKVSKKKTSENMYNKFETFRESPSINDALSILIGSTLIIFGITKPTRGSEFVGLRNDAVSYINGDGYWVRHTLAKSGIDDIRIDTDKPIPKISAKALLLIKSLSTKWQAIVSCNNHSDKLYFLPDNDIGDKTLGRELKVNRLNTYLDRFCDWVNLPTDTLGRRWYVREHELRKCFLITFFWCFRFSSLEAGRWVAGHTNSQNLYAYVQANFPGEELPNIEAQYAVHQLWLYEKGESGDSTNIIDLYTNVCEHFRVSSINLVAENDLLDWLEFAFINGSYQIQPYSIVNEIGNASTKVFFRISKVEKNEK